jgi:hypothetical protein
MPRINDSTVTSEADYRVQQTCNNGDIYWYPTLSAPAVYEPRCGLPAVVRYRSPGMVEGHWGYRCHKHGRGYLDDQVVHIEEILNQ